MVLRYYWLGAVVPSAFVRSWVCDYLSSRESRYVGCNVGGYLTIIGVEFV